MGHEVWVSDVDQDKALELQASCLDVGVLFLDRTTDPIDAAFICTPADVRLGPIQEAVNASIRGIFVEKPLALDMTTAESILGLLDGWKGVDMGACNMRYDGLLEGFVLPPDAVEVEYRMGQHAKYWSAGHKPVTMILDSIHELDLALHFNRSRVTGHMGASDESRANCWLKHENGTKSLIHIDRETDPPERWIKWTDGRSVLGQIDLWPGDPEMYRREMEDFLRCVELGKPSPNPLRQAAEVLGWALEVAG